MHGLGLTIFMLEAEKIYPLWIDIRKKFFFVKLRVVKLEHFIWFSPSRYLESEVNNRVEVYNAPKLKTHIFDQKLITELKCIRHQN